MPALQRQPTPPSGSDAPASWEGFHAIVQDQYWYVQRKSGELLGPLHTSQLVHAVLDGRLEADAWVAVPNGTQWLPLNTVPEIVESLDAEWGRLSSSPMVAGKVDPEATLLVPSVDHSHAASSHDPHGADLDGDVTLIASASQSASMRVAVMGSEAPGSLLLVTPYLPPKTVVLEGDSPSRAPRAPRARAARPARPSRLTAGDIAALFALAVIVVIGGAWLAQVVLQATRAVSFVVSSATLAAACAALYFTSSRY